MTLDMLALRDAIVHFVDPPKVLSEVEHVGDDVFDAWPEPRPDGDEAVLWALARDCVGGSRHWRVRQLAKSTCGWWTRRGPGGEGEWRFVPMHEWVEIFDEASARPGFADELVLASA